MSSCSLGDLDLYGSDNPLHVYLEDSNERSRHGGQDTQESFTEWESRGNSSHMLVLKSGAQYIQRVEKKY
jgi:hypothetical protein